MALIGGRQCVFPAHVRGRAEPVTATNVLPVASWRAVTVTPGSTPPELSLTVPESVASCAKEIAGIIRSTAIKSRRLTTRTSSEAGLLEKDAGEYLRRDRFRNP
jgi:hypothetical protein